MPYDPGKQFRCDIIRSRALNYIDDIISAYARIIHDICPAQKTDFDSEFDSKLEPILLALNQKADAKALANHRTETAKTLFGMYYIENDIVYESQRTAKFLSDSDQPAFFKDMLYKLQFPNGMTRNNTINNRINNGINCYPCSLVLIVLKEASNSGITLCVREIGYYVLNSLDALSQIATPKEIVERIISDRNQGLHPTIKSYNGSNEWQHISGLLHYMYYANLINYNNKNNTPSGNRNREVEITINPLEASTIKRFTDHYSDKLDFDIYDKVLYPRNNTKERKIFQLKWDKYFCSLSQFASTFYTLPNYLISSLPSSSLSSAKTKKAVTTLIGKAGEKYVFQYEQKKLGAQYQNLVNDKSSQRGIGYDIESAILQNGTPKTVYIEVKTTTRTTPPPANSYMDVINITRNEWKAAKQYKDLFFIYRVYITKGKIFIYQMKNIYQKEQNNLITIDSPAYELQFDINKSGVIDVKDSI